MQRMRLFGLFNLFKKEKIEAAFSNFKQFGKAKLVWYKADVPLALTFAKPEDFKNKKPSSKEEASCAVIKLNGKDVLFAGGDIRGGISFLYEENFNQKDYERLSSMFPGFKNPLKKNNQSFGTKILSGIGAVVIFLLILGFIFSGLDAEDAHKNLLISYKELENSNQQLNNSYRQLWLNYDELNTSYDYLLEQYKATQTPGKILPIPPSPSVNGVDFLQSSDYILINYPNIKMSRVTPTGSMLPVMTPAYAVLTTTKFNKYTLEIGNIVIYGRNNTASGESERIIHRIVKIDYDSKGNFCYIIQGDNNDRPDSKCVYPEQVQELVVGMIFSSKTQGYDMCNTGYAPVGKSTGPACVLQTKIP